MRNIGHRRQAAFRIPRHGGRVLGFLIEADDPPVRVHGHDAEFACGLLQGHRDTANGHVGFSLGVVRQEGAAPVMVLSLEHLLESVYRSATAVAAAEFSEEGA